MAKVYLFPSHRQLASDEPSSEILLAQESEPQQVPKPH